WSRADQHRVKEASVDTSDILEADCPHQSGNLLDRNREIAGFQDRGVRVGSVGRRDLERQVVARPGPCPDLTQMIATSRPDSLAVWPHLDGPGRRRRSIVAHRHEAAAARPGAAEAFAERGLDLAWCLQVWKGVVTDNHNVNAGRPDRQGAEVRDDRRERKMP